MNKILMKNLWLRLALTGGVLMISSCSFWGKHPTSWWLAVPEASVYKWEVAPDEADPEKNEVILSKRNELGGFSNFSDYGFELDGVHYASLEGFWQSMKYPEDKEDERFKNKNIQWPLTRDQVRLLTGFDAKRAGDIASENMKDLNIDWVTYKGQKIRYQGAEQQMHYDLIYRASVAKINQNPELKKLLIKTHPLILLPDHQIEKPDLPSYNYPAIYMKIRHEILSK